ncbi:MAG: ABC transporter permease, partial [Thiomicrorhabdus chilensis]|nr:ABC transporter permease [Thiomicrorhabdus chilensis]
MFRYVSYSIILIWVLMAALGFWIGDQANEVMLTQFLQPPDTQALLGTDQLGRPVLERIVLGAQTSLFVAVGV